MSAATFECVASIGPSATWQRVEIAFRRQVRKAHQYAQPGSFFNHSYPELGELAARSQLVQTIAKLVATLVRRWMLRMPNLKKPRQRHSF